MVDYIDSVLESLPKSMGGTPVGKHLFTMNHVHHLFLHLIPRAFTTMWPSYCSYASGIDLIYCIFE